MPAPYPPHVQRADPSSFRALEPADIAPHEQACASWNDCPAVLPLEDCHMLLLPLYPLNSADDCSIHLALARQKQWLTFIPAHQLLLLPGAPRAAAAA